MISRPPEGKAKVKAKVKVKAKAKVKMRVQKRRSRKTAPMIRKPKIRSSFRPDS